jgi:hypothetical protein
MGVKWVAIVALYEVAVIATIARVTTFPAGVMKYLFLAQLAFAAVLPVWTFLTRHSRKRF